MKQISASNCSCISASWISLLANSLHSGKCQQLTRQYYHRSLNVLGSFQNLSTVRTSSLRITNSLSVLHSNWYNTIRFTITTRLSSSITAFVTDKFMNTQKWKRKVTTISTFANSQKLFNKNRCYYSFSFFSSSFKLFFSSAESPRSYTIINNKILSYNYYAIFSYNFDYYYFVPQKTVANNVNFNKILHHHNAASNCIHNEYRIITQLTDKTKICECHYKCTRLISNAVFAIFWLHLSRLKIFFYLNWQNSPAKQ